MKNSIFREAASVGGLFHFASSSSLQANLEAASNMALSSSLNGGIFFGARPVPGERYSPALTLVA